MKYLVLDTNIYLHFKHFEQIDWKSLFNDDVTICVPQRVLVEIDKHKDQSRGKIQKKAKTISARLGEVLLQGLTSQVPLKDIPDPPATAFDDPQYHKEISDDWIILSALHCSINNTDIVIVAYDNGILLKAKQHGLCFFSMPDSFLIADEPSEEEKEIKQLRQQLDKFKNRLPNPKVEFEGETALLTIEKPQLINIKDELAAYEQELKGSHAYQPLTDARSSSDISYLFGSITQHAYSTIEQRKKYNKELDEYFEKKLKLKKFLLYHDIMEQRFRKISFILANVGTAPLGDTTVFFTFPAEVKLYSQKSKDTICLDDPAEPVLENNLNRFGPNLMSLQYGYKDKKKNIEIWSDKKTLDHQEIKYFSNRLTHGMCVPLENNEDIYIDISQCGNFAIKWEIIDSELIDPVEGELHVVVK